MVKSPPNPLQLSLHGKKHEISAIIFDLDGTLYDKKPLKWFIISKLWYQIHWLYKYDRTRKLIVGQDCQTETDLFNRTLEKLSPKKPLQQAKWKRWIETQYFPVFYKGFEKSIKPYPVADLLIQKLFERGIKLACVSDYPEVPKRLKLLGINPDWFTYTLGTEEAGMMKPAIRVAEITLEKLDVTASKCLMIGDRADTDQQLAINAGMQFIGIISDSSPVSSTDETWSHWNQIIDRLFRAMNIDLLSQNESNKN